MNKQNIIILVLVILAGASAWYFLGRQQGETDVSDAEDTVTGQAEAAPEDNYITKGELQDLLAEHDLNPQNVMVIDIDTGGSAVIRMYPGKAPNHVDRFRELAREGFYDGVVFHRVIDGFMAQTGDPTGTGGGGSGRNIGAEFNDIAHVRGVVSTARAADPDSADSQFFIMLDEAPHLDGQYTAWGEVVAGMEHVDAITKGPREANGVVPEEERNRMLRVYIAADVLNDGVGE